MHRLWRLAAAVPAVLATLVVTLAAQTPAAQDRFVPVAPGDLQREQIPAAPLVFIAYAFVWIVFVVYLFTLWRRMRRIDADLQTLASKVKGSAR
jgi:CcmD family protein